MANSLHDAARNGNLIEITAAIGEKADLNVRDQHKRTPLMLAAWAGHSNVVRALLAAGADATLGASDNMNALHFAAQKGHAECARLLIVAGIKVNSKNSRTGANALIMASQQGHLEVVDLLLKRHANPLATARSGKTAKDVCKEGCDDVKELLEAAEAAAAEAKNAEIQKRKDKNAERFAPITKPIVPEEEPFVSDAPIGPDLGPFAAQQDSGKQSEIVKAGQPDDGSEKQKRKGQVQEEDQRPAEAKKPRVVMNYDEEDFDDA